MNRKSNERREGSEGPKGSKARPIRRPEAETLLTEREWEVIDLQAEGKSYQAIADRLELSVFTVRNHLVHVREKLGAGNVTEAIRKAYLRLGE